MLGDFISRCLLMFFGYAYPAFCCFKTVEKNRADIEQLRFWCSYWIIMVAMMILERITDVFISWLPLYSEMKLGFTIYLWHPKTLGAEYVYQNMLRPLIARHENDIDRTLMEWRARGWDLAMYYLQNCSLLGQNAVVQILQFLATRTGKFSESTNKDSIFKKYRQS